MDPTWDTVGWEEADFRRILDAVTSSSSNQDMCFVSFCAVHQYHHLLKAIEFCGWKHPSFIVLHKTNKESAGSKRFTTTNEYMVMCFRSSSAKHIWNYEESPHLRTDLWEHPIVNNHYICTDDDKPVNRCQKSTPLLKRLLRHHSTPGCMVLDICAGSHALLFACLEMQRSCVSIEKDHRQYNASVQRMRLILQQKKNSMKKRLSVAKVGPVQVVEDEDDEDDGEKPKEKNGSQGTEQLLGPHETEDKEAEKDNIYGGDTLPMETPVTESFIQDLENLAGEFQSQQ